MKNIISGCVCFFAMLAAQPTLAQTALSGYVRDAQNGEALIGASVAAPDFKIGTTTGAGGQFSLSLPVSDSIILKIHYIGFQTLELRILPKSAVQPLEILLQPEGELEEIIISTTRTNSRIEDLPVKIEVLGAAELDEEVSLVPGGMGSLLGDLSIITIQRTGAVSGNDAVRMQGLAPGYTQLLRDGLPLYGGFSGSLGVLNIPPLDLRQVEIVKGSSSTLYGGGAIGGLINFLSKTPTEKPKATVLLNQTSLGETNADAFFSRKIGKNQGFTLLAAATNKPARDLNSDGFAEIAQSRQVLFHPMYFFGMGKKMGGNLGFSFSGNQIWGGDFSAVRQNEATADHPFFQKENAQRLTANGQIQTAISKNATWTLRGAGSVFNRGGNYAGLDFEGRQTNSYLETNVFLKKKRDDFVFGASMTGEHFDLISAMPAVAFGDYGLWTGGFFAQIDHRFSKKMIIQGGFRADENSRFGLFLLPRISILIKPAPTFSTRLGYGRGYKTPDLFAAAEPTEFLRLQPLQNSVKPDVANSLNADLNFRKLFFEKLSVEINQAFYYVGLARPFAVRRDSSGLIFLENDAATGNVLGTDTYLQLHFEEWEFYLGYNRTLSERRSPDGTRLKEAFNPQEKIAATFAWSIPDKWRFGIETAMTGKQFLDNQRKTPAFWFWAAMVARRFAWGTLVLNCENLGDARQANFEKLVTGSIENPVFSPIWAPIEGRVFNFSIKLDW